ncbi:DNA repair protein RecO [Peredibacter sp. HCB2-198]|uniref:DNA repair protein RecO n=1 Tax=Peredibacter sp. HCB2-198 TaxID=3383025 RepID=UPI0038B438E3
MDKFENEGQTYPEAHLVFEGLVIHRVPYKERDLIVKLLLRNGMVGSFYIYGGQGGGKSHKPSIFELGSMMRIMIKDQKTKIDSSDLMISAEHSRIWEPQSVRHDIRAFYLVCLYFELISKFSITFQPGTSDYQNLDHEGVFSVVSNALFYIEDALVKKQFEAGQHLTLFMVKLLFHLGIMPDTDNCSYCQADLLEIPGVVFMPANGQFACQNCAQGENERGFLLRIKKGYQTRYQEYAGFLGTNFSECDKLIQYFCHQYHLRPVELRSYSLLFK